MLVDVGFKQHVVGHGNAGFYEVPAGFAAPKFQSAGSPLTDGRSLLAPVSTVVPLKTGKPGRLVLLALTADGQVAAFMQPEAAKR